MNQTIIFQRLEYAALLFVASYLYFYLGNSFTLYALLFFVFDISMLGYLHSKYWGAIIYNIGHSLIIPLGLLLCGTILSSDLTVSVALIWCAHIGFDRMLGYGLKLKTGFRDTHLGQIGGRSQ